MNQDIKKKQCFLLRLPVSIRETATKFAFEEGTSLNHFISLAIAEKLARMEKRNTASASPPPLRGLYREGVRLF